MKTIKVADYTTFPGGRYRSDGEHSAQQFREKYLEPLFEESGLNEKVLIDLDGVAGYSTAFLEEVFGGLVRKYHDAKKILSKFEFKCEDEPLLKNEIINYITMES